MAPVMLTLSKDGAFLVDNGGAFTQINDESWGSATGVLQVDDDAVLITHPQGTFMLDITKDKTGADIPKDAVTAVTDAVTEAAEAVAGYAGDSALDGSKDANGKQILGQWFYLVDGYGRFEYGIGPGDDDDTIIFTEPDGNGFKRAVLTFDGEFWTGTLNKQVDDQEEDKPLGTLRVKYMLGGKLQSNFRAEGDEEWQDNTTGYAVGGNKSTKLSKERWAMNGPMVRPESDPNCIICFHETGVWKMDIKTGISAKLPASSRWQFVSGCVYVPADSELFVAGKAVLFHPTGIYGVDLTTGKDTQLARGNWGGVRGATYDPVSKKAIVLTIIGQFRVDLMHGTMETIGVTGKKDEGWAQTPGSIRLGRWLDGFSGTELLAIRDNKIVKFSVSKDLVADVKKAAGGGGNSLAGTSAPFVTDGSFKGVRCLCSIGPKSFCSLGGRNDRKEKPK